MIQYLYIAYFQWNRASQTTFIIRCELMWYYFGNGCDTATAGCGQFGNAPAYPLHTIRFPRFGFDKRAS
jgi:hypothetical protein